MYWSIDTQNTKSKYFATEARRHRERQKPLIVFYYPAQALLPRGKTAAFWRSAPPD